MKFILPGLGALLCLTHPAGTQNPSLLVDINQTPAWRSPSPYPLRYPSGDIRRGFVRLGKSFLISARIPLTGHELWISDGVQSHAKLLKDILPGLKGSRPVLPAATRDGKRVFFVANDGSPAPSLWITDGTSSGTRPVAKAVNPMSLVTFGTSSVVGVAWALPGRERIFVSDGTAIGTKFLTGVGKSSKNLRIDFLTSSRDGKKVFFTAYDWTNGQALWVTDGTSQGTRIVKDLRAGGPILGRMGPFIRLGQGKVVFQVSRSIGELWVSDGTAKGTSQIPVHTSLGLKWIATTQAISLGNRVLFSASNGKSGYEPYITDGTVVGTKLLIDAWPGKKDGEVFFPCLDSTGKKVYWTSLVAYKDYRIFVSDGTPAGTKMFTPKNVGRIPLSIVESRGKVYFSGVDVTPGTGTELCVSDGTAKGTKTLRDGVPGVGSGEAAYLTRIGPSRIVFTSWNSRMESRLWMMVAGVAFRKIAFDKTKGPYTKSSNPEAVVRFGNRIVFSADDGKSGREPWVSDGTVAGTKLVKDIYPGPSASFWKSCAALGDKVVIDGYAPGVGYALFTSDGTSAGTRILVNIGQRRSSKSAGFTSIGGRVYYVLDHMFLGWVPWVTDGTAAGTHKLKDLNPVNKGSAPGDFAGIGTLVVFRSFTPKTGNELFINDGTKKGTRLLKDIYPGAKSSHPSEMTFCGGRVYFSATSPKNGRELWVTDFTSQGTRIVKDILPGVGSSWPQSLSARDGRISFSAYTAATGFELFQSDGTATGTRLFLDYKPGPSSSFPSFISSLGSRKVYFAAFTKGKGNETIVSDGTILGTRVLDINPGNADGYGFADDSRTHRVVLGSQVFLRGIHASLGAEFFTVDNGATTEPLGTPYRSTWIHGGDPVLGKTATITGGTSLTRAVEITIVGSLAARPMRVSRMGFAHFDLTSYFGIAVATQGKSFSHTFTIPASPTLKGVQVVFQTLAFDSNNLAGTLEFSNGLHWAIGN